MNEMEKKGGMKGKGKMKGGCKGYGKGMGRKRRMHGMGAMEEPKKKYAYVRQVEIGFDETVEKVKEELKKEGFGVLSEIRVDKLFKEKLDLDMNPT